ncbi:MAG: guanylate kinase [Chitinophagales bacterium]
MSPKLLVFTAPSGAGKTTIVRHLLEKFSKLEFSVSATTRAQRPHETDGKDYYFLSEENFKKKIEQDAFLEWEEVYKGSIYGTLHSEIERISSEGKIAVFDIDVKGALNIKQQYGNEAFTIFVKPPSLEVLIERLSKRGTEDETAFQKRVDRMKYEMSCEKKFDFILLNDELPLALEQAEQLVLKFI